MRTRWDPAARAQLLLSAAERPVLPKVENGPAEAYRLLGSFLLALTLILSLSFARAPALSTLFAPISLGSARNLCLLLSAGFAALVAHELGHALAAVCCGFDVSAISLGVFTFMATQQGWRLRFSHRRLFTGAVHAVPRTNEFWRARMAAVIAAGPLATLGSGFAAAALALAFQEQTTMLFFLRAFLQLSFVIFAVGMIPNGSGARRQNDAALLLALWKDGARANEIFLYHLVLQEQKKGSHPDFFPFWLIRLMATYEGKVEFMVFYAGLIAGWAFSRGNLDAGDAWDRRAIRLSALLGPAAQNTSLANSACFDLAFRNDALAAREKLNRVQLQTIASPSLQCRVIAARDLAFGRIAHCLAAIAEARTFLPRHAPSGGFEFLLLKRLHLSAISFR